jgi:hypothetical protein
MDSIILQTGDNTVTDGDVIGRLGFAASSETGTNARLVVAKIEAVAEEAFDASNNATEMVFYLAADGAAASKMTLTSAGNLNIAGSLDISDGNITNVGDIDCDSISIADAGTGLNIAFGGNTTLNKMTLTDNLADALNITEGSNSYMKFVTTDNATRIIHNVGVVSNPTALTSQSGSVVINAALGNYFTVATSGAITGLDIQNAIVGQKILIRFAWGGTHSIAYTDTVIWPGGTAASVTASGVDVIGFICTTASSAFDAFIVGEDVKAV